MSKPRLLDLFCGAGGAAKGYQRAGFYVVGVDIKAQPHYCGDEFYQADAMTYPMEGFDAIHASPPCQGYSVMRHLPWIREKEYPLLINATRARLEAAGMPYAIENVMGARLEAAWLCGLMFDLRVFRHRYFETNFLWLAPGHPRHSALMIQPGRMLGNRARGHSQVIARSATRDRKANYEAGGMVTVTGDIGSYAGGAMGIDWMTGNELSQAIPPAYTEFIGKQLMAALR